MDNLHNQAPDPGNDYDALLPPLTDEEIQAQMDNDPLLRPFSWEEVEAQDRRRDETLARLVHMQMDPDDVTPEEREEIIKDTYELFDLWHMNPEEIDSMFMSDKFGQKETPENTPAGDTAMPPPESGSDPQHLDP